MIGSECTRRPVAWKTAFAMAAAMPVALVGRALQQHVVNVAQHGGMCAMMVSAKAIHGAADGAAHGPAN